MEVSGSQELLHGKQQHLKVDKDEPTKGMENWPGGRMENKVSLHLMSRLSANHNEDD